MSGRGGLPDIEGMTSLKVDNLTFRTTPEDLKRAFTKYGEVGDVYIPRDRFSKESRGFAFIRFFDKHDAEDAMESMDGYVLDGRELRVQMARYGRPADPYRRSGGRDGGRDSGRRYGGGGGGGRSGGGSSRRRSRSRSRSRSRRGRSESRSRSRSNSHRRQRSHSKSRSPKYVSKSHSQSPQRELSVPLREMSPRRSRSRSKSN